MSHLASEVIEWVKQSIGSKECSAEIQDTIGQGLGFVADIFSVKVTLDGPDKELNVIAKVSPKNQRKFADVCQREVIFYSEIIPIFKQFQEEKHVANPFNAVPKCYKAFVTEGAEVIVQENMMFRGYELHKRHLPFNISHIKLILKNYAKFHAISFALYDQRRDVFNRIERLCCNLFPEKIRFYNEMYDAAKSKIIHNLNKVGREDLAKKYEILLERGSAEMVLDLLEDLPQERVLTHADCHNGNFMFEYKDDLKENPSNVVFLDFQLTCMLSPMCDLSLFWYWGASKKEFSHFTELMEYYHQQLSSFMLQLESDVNKLYPIAKMWEHWKNYSHYGFIRASVFFELLFIEKNNSPSVANVAGFSDVNVKKENLYLERLVDIVEHYIHSQSN